MIWWPHLVRASCYITTWRIVDRQEMRSHSVTPQSLLVANSSHPRVRAYSGRINPVLSDVNSSMWRSPKAPNMYMMPSSFNPVTLGTKLQYEFWRGQTTFLLYYSPRIYSKVAGQLPRREWDKSKSYLIYMSQWQRLCNTLVKVTFPTWKLACGQTSSVAVLYCLSHTVNTG